MSQTKEIPHCAVKFEVGEELSSGSSGRVRGGPRNMKSMRPPSAAIFFMTYFYRARGGPWPPWPPPGSATGTLRESDVILNAEFTLNTSDTL